MYSYIKLKIIFLIQQVQVYIRHSEITVKRTFTLQSLSQNYRPPGIPATDNLLRKYFFNPATNPAWRFSVWMGVRSEFQERLAVGINDLLYTVVLCCGIRNVDDPERVPLEPLSATNSKCCVRYCGSPVFRIECSKEAIRINLWSDNLSKFNSL